MPTFLIADDSDGKATMLEAVVLRWSKAERILRAKTTEEAKKLIDAHPLAWAFIDYEMPSENGPAVIAYLREKQPHCRIAMVSSSNSGAYKHDAAKAGAEAYVCSSFDADEVENALNDVLHEW